MNNRNTIGATNFQSRMTEKLPPINQGRGTMGAYDNSGRYVAEEEYSYEQRGTLGNYGRPMDNSMGGGEPGYVDQNQSDNLENKAFIIDQRNATTYEFDCNGGRPLQLIQVAQGQFTLNQEAVDELSQFEGNVSFVSVAGKYRTGKSFLLNKILGLKGQGFRVDPTTDSCTQGIWIWSKPIYIEKDNLYVFFMDTEGSNSIEKSAQHDAKIFALAILMSSFFIYNSVGVIDENTINELSLTTQLSKNIAVSADEMSSEYALSYYTPKFLWVLRDFTLELLDTKGRPITSSQYLENALTDQSTVAKTSETNRKIRAALLNFFKDRDALTLVRPVNDEIALKRLDKLSDNQIRPEFAGQLKKLKEKLLTKVTAKQLKGVNLKPKMYFAAVAKYVEAINSGSVPTISTAWEHMVDSECRDAMENAVNLYEIALKQFFLNAANEAKSMEEIYHILKNIRDQTLDKYSKFTGFIDKHPKVSEHKEKLKEYLDQREHSAMLINEEIAQANNEEILKVLSKPVKDNLSVGIYGENNVDLYCEDFNTMAVNYDNQAKGLNKTSSFIAFLNTYNKQALQSIIATLKKNFSLSENKFITEKSKAGQVEEDLRNKIKLLETKEETYNNQLSKIRNEKAVTDEKNKQLEREIQKMKAEDNKAAFEAEYKKKMEAQEKSFAKEKADYMNEMAEMQKKLNQKKACCTIF